jgi:hypothetical protein
VAAGLTLALALVHPAAAIATTTTTPRLEDVLSLAGRYVTRLEEQLAILVADETSTQSVFVGRESSLWQRRALVSDVAWVPTGDPFVWAFFRDVREVDGDPVRDRDERLAHLFPSGVTLSGTERAFQILEESARYNLGPHRTVNSPTVALSFLHPRNRWRFDCRLEGQDERQGVATWRVRFSERARPTLVRSSRGQDVPARGLFWLEAGSAALVESRLELHLPDFGPIVIETLYAHDDRLGAWLPTEMREAYGRPSRSSREPHLEAVARYSGWRRAQVEVQVILPAP